MSKYKIEVVKEESKGVLCPEFRSTVKDTEGQVRTSDWQETKAEATQEATERLSSPPKKK